MAFQFKNSSCVAVGTFNVYIFQPWWVARQETEEPDVEITTLQDFSRPGRRYRSPKFQCTWTIRPDRLVLESARDNADCGKLMASVIGALPVTPLFAVGNNYSWACKPEDSDLLRTVTFPKAEPDAALSVAQRTWHIAVEESEYTFNLQLAEQKSEIVLSANVHRSLEGFDLDKRVEPALTSAEMHVEFREKVAEMFLDTLDIEVNA